MTASSRSRLVGKVGPPADSWVAFPYAANWADVGFGWQTGRYRRLPNNKVRVEFFASRSGSSSGANAVIGTLPAGYRPLSTKLVGEMWTNAGAYAANQVSVDSAGQILTATSIVVGGAVPVFAEFSLD